MSHGFPIFLFRLGTMHLFCTNVIVWIRTLIKESLMEIDETEEEAHKHEHDGDVKGEVHMSVISNYLFIIINV